MSNKTIALPELAASIATLAGCDADTARAYVVDIFARVQQQLAASRTADVPGIGTFRLDGADILFEPSPALAQAANTPFAMFEPIELPGEYTDEDAPDDVPASPMMQEIAEAAVEQPEEVVEESPVETTMEEDQRERKEVYETTQEEVYKEQEQEQQQQQEEESEEDTSSRSYLPWLTAAFGLIAGLAIGYFIGTRCVAPMPPVAIVEPAEQISAVPDTTTAAAPTDTIVPEPEAEPEPPAAHEVKEPVYDKVSSSRFLTTIARDHYGRKDYWVFIYEANSDILRHPNKIRPGTRVVVPDLGENAAANADLRARAHKLAAEISARYDL